MGLTDSNGQTRYGIGQGFNEVRAREVQATGGWVALSFDRGGPWEIHTGVGLDNAYDGDVSEPDGRTFNRVFFANAWYDLASNVAAGFEVSHLYTKYKAQEKGDSVRLQLSLRYTF